MRLLQVRMEVATLILIAFLMAVLLMAYRIRCLYALVYR
jgi:hypothetical protein